MDKFKMELTWHNCKTCPPEEAYNPFLIYTNGRDIDYFRYYKRWGFPIAESSLHEYWWADISRTVRESKEFEEVTNEASV